MPRGREDLPRQFPAVQFQVVCNAMTAAGLPPDASLSQVMSLIDFVLCNPTVFDHWLRARHPRRHLGERSGNRAWESFTARCFLTWSNWRALDGPPLQVDVVVGCLDRIAGLVGMDRFPEGFSSVASVLPPTPPVITAFESIRVPLLLVPEDIECAEPACGRRRLHLATDATHATSSFALRNGLALFCQAVTSECPNCARRYTVDGSSTLDPLSGSRSHAYTNEAPFLRVGDNLYVDRHFAATQDAAIYRFHANFGSFANFVSDALGSSSPTARERYRFTQRQSKALFVQASLRRIAASVGQTFHSQSDLDSGRLAAAAYEALANPTPGVHVQLGGYFPAGRSHSCNTCHLPAMAAAPAVVQMVPGVGQNGVGLEGNPVAAPVQGQEVSCAAIDGLVVGPYRCSYTYTVGQGNQRRFRRCAHPPANFRQSPLCRAHLAQHGHLCHVIDCNAPLLPPSRACPAHQHIWNNWQHAQRREVGTMAAFTRRILRFRQQPGLAWLQPLVGAGNVPHDQAQPAEDEVPEQVNHYFQARRYYCLENCLHCCGVPIAWAAFPFSESDPNIVQFMTSIWSDWLSGGPARPSYLVIDKACRILRHLINAANGLWQVWFQTTRFKVDGFHWRNHRTNDQLCQVWCNVRDPADPQLMRRVVDGQGVEQMVSAFNSESQEQMLVWLAGYESAMKRMELTFYLWFVHAVLHLRLTYVLAGRHGVLGAQEDDEDEGGD